MSSQFLWKSEFAKQKTKPKQKPKQSTPAPAVKSDGVLTQGNCADINSGGLPKNGSSSIVWPGCGITLTFYEAIQSESVQAILKQYPNLYIVGGYPAKPEGYGALITTQYGMPQSLFPYTKGLIFALQNEAISGGSYYNMTCPKPNSSFRAQPLSLKSHDVQVTIPGVIYAGPGTDCGLGGPSTPKP